jgi:hypothetical protein
MRRVLGALALLLGIAILAGGIWLGLHPGSPLVAKAAGWPVVGPVARALHADARPLERPYALPGEPGAPAASSPPSLSAGGPEPVLEPERERRIAVRPGTVLLAEPRAGAERIFVVPAMSYLKVVDRRPDWLRVLYERKSGWVPDPDRSSAEPPLGSAPEPLRPVAGRAPDAQRLALARAGLAPPEISGHLGPYALYTDVRDESDLAFLDRVAAGLDGTYRGRYGVAPGGSPAEAVVLFTKEDAYRSFQNREEALAGLSSTGHSGYGIVALWDGNRPGEEVGATLAHELAHLLNRRALGPALPSWLDEGIADDLSLSKIDASGRLVPGTLGGVTVRAERRIEMYGARASLFDLAAAMDEKRERPLPELLAMDWSEFVREDPTRSYAESAFWVRYLLDGEGGALAGGFRDFLRGIAGGGSRDPEALREKLGRSWDELESGFRKWVQAERDRL